LHSIDGVAECPSTVEALAVEAGGAESAVSAGADAYGEDPVADSDVLDRVADFGDDSGGFMPEDGARGDCRNPAFDDVQGSVPQMVECDTFITMSVSQWRVGVGCSRYSIFPGPS
jgi:hypothetical protein